jgi:hypothetical protein
VTAGVLTNAPTIGIKALKAADWYLVMPTSLSGLGLLLSMALGVSMARRPKMPFVTAPGLISCALCLGMALAPEPFWFLLLLGLVNLFETITRPAMTAIIRANYPVADRGWITGDLRQWSAGAFLVAVLATARLLDAAGTWPVIRVVLAGAAALQAAGYLALARIHVRSEEADIGEGPAPAERATIAGALADVRRDGRFLRYLSGCFLFGMGALSYDPILRAYFSTELHLDYVECALLMDVVPSVCSVLTVARLGAWLDRTNPLRAWAAIRVAWGLDPILLALAPIWPSAALPTAVGARILRGGVMNGSWLLWWQLGTNYFALRRELTSVYMGLHISLNGVQRILAPALGACLAALTSRREVLIIGGLLVIASAVLAWRQAESEKGEGRYPTFADRERMDLAT